MRGDSQCSVVSIHPASLRSPQPCERGRFIESEFIFTFTPKHITLNDYDNFFRPSFFGGSEYAQVLFAVAGLLQIKEQTTRSFAAASSTLQLRGLGDWSVGKGHQLP